MTTEEKVNVLEKEVSEIKDLLSTFIPDYLELKNLVDDICILLQKQSISENEIDSCGEKDIRELIKRTRP